MMMASVQSVETSSVTLYPSPTRDYSHQDDHTAALLMRFTLTWVEVLNLAPGQVYI